MRSSASKRLLKIRKHPCVEDGLWVVEFDYRGTGQAAFCSVRANHQPPSPLPGEVTPRVLDELSRMSRRPPNWVWMNPFADAFVPGAEDLAETTLSLLPALLSRDVGVTLRTRGGLPHARPLVMLGRRFPEQLRVEVAFFTENMALQRQWEHGCASVRDRLDLIQALKRAGVDVVARVGPVVPMVNDDDESIVRLMRVLMAHGVDEVSLSWLADRPGLRPQIAREVSRSKARVLGGFFSMHEGPRRDQELPDAIKTTRMDRFKAAAKPLGLELLRCRCSATGNQSCIKGPGGVQKRQLGLFSEG